MTQESFYLGVAPFAGNLGHLSCQLFGIGGPLSRFKVSKSAKIAQLHAQGIVLLGSHKHFPLQMTCLIPGGLSACSGVNGEYQAELLLADSGDVLALAQEAVYFSTRRASGGESCHVFSCAPWARALSD